MLKLMNVTKQFKNQVVLSDVSLNFGEGKIHGLLGRNGSGKTVLLKLISGLSKPNKGEIYYNDKLLGCDIEHPDSMGLIIESPGFLLNKTGLQNLLYLASLKNRITEYDVINNIKRVGLDPYDRKHVGKYSLGMKQRLGIAQAIMEKPDLILLDEPFNGIDKEGVALMRDILKMTRDNGAIIIMASHVLEDITMLCDNLLEIKDGYISQIS